MRWLIVNGFQTKPVKVIDCLPKQNGNMAAGGGAQNRSKWAGMDSKFILYKDHMLQKYMNLKGTRKKDRFEYTGPVKSFKASSLGTLRYKWKCR